MSAAAVIAIRRKRFVRKFREAGAIDPQHATTPESLGERRSWIFNHMADQGVFPRTTDGRFYLDEQAAIEFLKARKRRALWIVAILSFVFVLIWLFGQNR